MWQPDPGWHPLRGGTSTSTYGVWRAQLAGLPVVIKRIARPSLEDPAELLDPTHFAWWRRPAEVAVSGVADRTLGLRSPLIAVEEDAEGITLTQEWVEDAALNGLFGAMSLGRFSRNDVPARPWLARDQLRSRLVRIESKGGWQLLSRTAVAPLTLELWGKRGRLLDELDLVPQVLQHGDPTAANLLGRQDDDLIAIDWETFGTGPVGSDLGYYALGAREAFDPLLEAYLMGRAGEEGERDVVLRSALVTMVYTAFNRAEWALRQQVARTPDVSLAIRDPSVAPHLRALQRQYAAVEAVMLM